MSSCKWPSGGPKAHESTAACVRCQCSSVASQGDLTQRLGGPLAVLNGAVAPDVLMVAVPADVQLESPVHVVYISSGESTSNILRLRILLWHSINVSVAGH